MQTAIQEISQMDLKKVYGRLRAKSSGCATEIGAATILLISGKEKFYRVL